MWLLFTGAIHLNKPIARVPKGLVHLNLAHCGLTSKGVNNIAHALSQNKTMHTTLTYLNLSGNNLKDEINVSSFHTYNNNNYEKNTWIWQKNH